MVIFYCIKSITEFKRKDTQQVKTRYRIIQSKATAFEGLYVVDEFLEKLNFNRIFG